MMDVLLTKMVALVIMKMVTIAVTVEMVMMSVVGHFYKMIMMFFMMLICGGFGFSDCNYDGDSNVDGDGDGDGDNGFGVCGGVDGCEDYA